MGNDALGGLVQQHFAGAAVEHAAASWFLGQGYQVWWPAVNQSKVDFLVERNGKRQRVQVKKATWNKAYARREYLQIRVSNTNRPYKRTDLDLLVSLDEDGRMWIIPWTRVFAFTCLHLDKRGPGKENKAQRSYNPDRWRVR